MAKRKTKRKQWSICSDGLEPLAAELLSLASRFNVLYDFDTLDQLDYEYQTIQEASPYSDRLLTNTQRDRLAELLKLMSAWKEPPCPRDVENLYEKYHVGKVAECLKSIISVEYADDFSTTLLNAKKRFTTLDFKACKRLKPEDAGEESVVQIRYAIPRLIHRYYQRLHEAFPGREGQPTGDELPDDLRKMEVEIVDEYEFVAQGIHKVAEYLQTVVALIRSRPNTVGDTKTDALYEVFSIYTDGSSDDRFKEMARIVSNDDLTLDEKLWAIHKLIPIPSSVSAEKLGKAFGVTKAAIQKTSWYLECRKGEQTKEFSRRRGNHVERGKERKDLPRKTGTQYKSEDWDK